MVQQNQTDITNELLKSITKRNFVDIQYKKKDDIKYFWIGIKKINVEARTLYVFGFNVGTKQRTDFDYPISLDSIIYAQCIDETYFETEESKDLINDIIKNPDKYSSIFNGRTENLKILDYLDECVQLNNTPYIPDEKLTLLDGIDNKRLKLKTIRLKDEEFEEIVEKLDKNLFKKKKVSNNTKTLYLCLNILSIIKNDKKKMYVLAYKKLSLDIKNQSLVADDEITFCKTFGIKNEDNNKEEIQQYEINEYLDNGDQYLLDDYEQNQETIKDIINNKIPSKWKVDDEPYIFPMQRKLVFNLKKEISAILKMQQENNYTPPIQAFLGKLISFPSKEKETPIVLLDENTNLDQLVAIENAMNDPVSYVQGPPGTGKTSTIVNIILTAFFNNKTVLFTSYNNKPINGVVDKLSKITYKNRQPLFPFIVVGRKDYIPDNLAKVKELLEIANKETVLEDLLETKKGQEIEKTKKISQLLQKYREKQDLENRIDVLEPLMEYTKDSFQFNIIFSGTESTRVQKELESMETIDCASTVALINENKNDFFMYMYFKSVQHLQMLNNDDYEDFRKILYIEDKDEQCKAFNNYLADDENIRKLQKVFPVFLSTCISSRRIGNPEPFFDITIMDEAGQCDTATSLVPILRGKNLLLVGDPQQLNPVVNLDKAVDEKLKKLYKVPETYDFLNNSIYKTYVSNDHISSETLLSHHYRCAPKIIRFNNKNIIIINL